MTVTRFCYSIKKVLGLFFLNNHELLQNGISFSVYAHNIELG